MKTMLIYDTETTGLPDWNAPSEHPSQPHITQIAAQLCDEETGQIILGSVNFLIKPDGWTITEDLQHLTGITMERAERFGVPLVTALSAFTDLWEAADFRVAHNENFDARMLRISYFRFAPEDEDLHERWKGGTAFCTASKSTSIINLPPTEKMITAGRKAPKTPNLGEAYRFFTGKELVNAHNASVDLMACKAVYFGIRAHNLTENIHVEPSSEGQ